MSDTPPVVPSIDATEVAEIMAASCWTKRAYPSLHVARRIIAAHEAAGTVGPGQFGLQPYRCPFHTLHPGTHWHIGHAPRHEHVVRLALALRWCHAHPLEQPRPPATTLTAT